MFFRALVAALICWFLLMPGGSALARTHAGYTAAGAPQTFDTEAAAQRHCPRDVVICLNLPTGIYHEKGMRWYGRTKHGAFVCKADVSKAGDRDTRNGQ